MRVRARIEAEDALLAAPVAIAAGAGSSGEAGLRARAEGALANRKRMRGSGEVSEANVVTGARSMRNIVLPVKLSVGSNEEFGE